MFKSGMTRRQFAVSAATLCAMTAFGAGLAFAEDKKEEAAEVKLDGPFIVGFDQDFPPYGYVGDDVRTVDVTVRRLREKIEDDPASPRYILTRRGVGYYYSTL